MLVKKVLGFSSLVILLVVGIFIVSCQNNDATGEKKSENNGEVSTAQQNGNLSASADQIAKDRNLSPKDVEAALKTYLPSGKYDEYIMFSSGAVAGIRIWIRRIRKAS
jgi:nitrous-oxide reductase